MNVYEELCKENAPALLGGLKALKKKNINTHYVKELMVKDVEKRLIKTRLQALEIVKNLLNIKYPTPTKVESVLMGKPHSNVFSLAQHMEALRVKELEAIKKGTFVSQYSKNKEKAK